jgi:LysR family hydrogen peroxide-inducible transcriptional activator
VARRLVSEVGSLRDLFKPAKPRRPVRLGLMPSLDVMRARDLIAPLMHGGELDLRLVGADEPCDARIVSRTMRAENEVFHLLWKERFVLAVPVGHPLAVPRHGGVRLADLAGHRLVARCNCEYAARWVTIGGKLDVVAIAQSEEWALALVAAGTGIAVVPEGAVGKRDDVVKIALRDVKRMRHVGLAYEARGTSVELQCLVETLAGQRSSRWKRARPS